MALEPITRQEQIIAGKDLEPITRMEKFLKEYGGGGEYFETVGGDTLTWDGNTEGLTVVDMGGLPLYLVSEATPSQTHFNNGWGGTVTAIDTGEIGTASSDGTPSNCELTQMGEGCFQITIFDEFLFIIPTDNYSPADGILFPKKGIYATCSASGMYYLSSLTINGYTGFTTTRLKEEYIPVDYIKQLIAEVTGN